MKIPEKIFKIWSKKHSRGDVSRLVQFTNVSKPTIIKAIKHGEANEKNILKISEYYSEKKTTTQKEIELKALKLFQNESSENH